MDYKVEVSSTQTFPNGDIFNNKEEYFFEDDEPLTARSNAFDYLLSLSPKSNTTQRIVLLFCDDSGQYDELCSLTLWPLEDYDKEEIAERDFYLCFEIDNLHKERASYEDEKYFMGGPPIVLDDYQGVSEYDYESDEETEMPAKILAANRRFFTMSGELQRTE